MAHAMPPIRVHVHFDPSVQEYWANSPDLDGLAASGRTRAELEQEARLAAETLLELAGVAGIAELQSVDAGQE